MTTYQAQQNHDKAEEYFISIGAMPKKQDRTEKWLLHHIDPSWKENDPERYYSWNIQDLVPMTLSEHMRLHRKDMEVWNKGIHYEGHTHTEEEKQVIRENTTKQWQDPVIRAKMIKGLSESHKGQKAWNKGIQCEKLQCPYCEKLIGGESNLKQHIRAKHREV